MSPKKYSKLPLISRIKFWKDKYRDMPNGWVVGNLIGEEYVSDASKISSQKRKKEYAKANK
jgi:hypothetical protein|tara:strand:+ start:380 stop:562 length:183 start_codon:yes stop_codon:yes gene_type:complete